MKQNNFKKRTLIKALGLSPLLSWVRPLLAAQMASSPALSRIAFGSCCHQDKQQPVWNPINANQPDLFVFLGDNIYGDSDDPGVLASKYGQLASQTGFQALRAQTDILATWDDHDYGLNDAGQEYVQKEASRKLMLDFWNEPADSMRRTNPNGIYTAVTYGAPGKRVQIILLDLRWNRTALDQVEDEEDWLARDAVDMGPYLPNVDNTGQLMGEAQWQWLEKVLDEPAEVRIIASSIQLLAEFTGWETWANFPAERARILALLGRHHESLNLIISGDVHWCEYSKVQLANGRHLAEMTSSGLTETWDKISPNKHRIGPAFAVPNFGLIDFDWSGNKPAMTLSIRNEQDEVIMQHFYQS